MLYSVLIDTICAAALASARLFPLRLYLCYIHCCHGHQQNTNESGERQTTNMTDLHKGIHSISGHQDDVVVAVAVEVCHLQRDGGGSLHTCI